MATTLATGTSVDLATLAAIERRVLWLAVRIVDYANRERPSGDALKVGGHQTSSASMVTLMTALWLADLDARDRVSLKPHASPVLHALEYLLGRLDRSYLTRLRDFGGLQSYPSRTKDPYPVDYSTGSVGLGSAAPLFGALADRYVETHFGTSTGGRFISLLGDAELDEGNLWEAVAEPLTRGLGNALWIVDLNRQSLDRVIPGIRAAELEAHFRTSGWDVIELKYGHRLRAAFEQPGGSLLRQRIDEMPNEAYQALYGASPEDVRAALLEPFAGDDLSSLEHLLDETGDVDALVRDLGGHDLDDVLDGAASGSRDDRPTVGHLRLHDQGLRPRDRRPPAEPLRAPDRRPARELPQRGRADTRDRMGRLSGGLAGGRAARGRARAPRPRRPSAGADVRRAGVAHRARSVGPDLDPGRLRPRPPRALARRRTSASGS